MLQNIPREKVLEILKQGPNVPARIAKIVGGDSIIIGAILSTMVESGLVKISKLKIGGSPLYFLPEDEPKLENFTDKLNEKDRKTLNLLKESKVIRDSVQDPLTRVSLRQISDFAKSFHIYGSEELFWKYFLGSDEESDELAKAMVPKPEPISIEPVKIETPEPAQDKIEKTIEKIQEKADEIQEIDKTIKEEINKEIILEEKIPKEKTPKEKKVKPPKIDKVFEKLKEYFQSKNLDIINKEKIKKTEYDLILKNHNTDDYIYCKYKDKKTINEGDLAVALLSAKTKKMQCVFLTTGTLNKKAESMMEKELKELILEKI